MRIVTTTAWPVKRGMLLAGCVAVGCAVLVINLPPWSVFALAAAFLLLLLIPVFRHPVVVYVVLIAVVVLCLGGWYRSYVADVCVQAIGRRDTITAVVQEVPASGHMVSVRITASDTLPVGRRILLYCPEQAMPARYETVHGEVRYRALDETQSRYRADGVFLQAFPTAYGEDALTITAGRRSVASAMEFARVRLLDEIYRRLPNEEGALVAGLCLGELRGISEKTETAFRRAGLPHLLVVSGLHLSVIGGGVYAVLRVLLRRRRTAAVLSMGVVFLFSALVGFSPSVARAGVACFVLLGGQLFWRRADGLNSMGLALLLLLAANPYCLFDAGLLLSFGATAGILCLFNPLCHALRFMGRWLANGLAVTLAASLPIWPLLAYLFGEVSLVSPVANLLTVAPSGVSLLLGCLAMPLAMIPPLAFVADGLFFLAVWPMKWISWVARALGGLPLATLPVDHGWLFVYLTGLCCLSILCIWRQQSNMSRAVMAVMTALAVLAYTTSHVLVKDTVCVTVSVRYDSTLILLEHNGNRGLLVSEAEELYTDARLLRRCADGLDFLVVGSGNTPDTARLTDFLQHVPVKRIAVGGSQRWLTGLNLPVSPLPADAAVRLWDNVTLYISSADGWRLDYAGTTVALMPQGDDCVADAAVFVGGLPQHSDRYILGQAILVGELPTDTRTPYPVMALTDGERYLTARAGGDWSITRWR